MYRDARVGTAHSLRRAVGVFCLGLGSVGLLLPLVPGIPFLIVGGLLLRSRRRYEREDARAADERTTTYPDLRSSSVRRRTRATRFLDDVPRHYDATGPAFTTARLTIQLGEGSISPLRHRELQVVGRFPSSP